MVDKFSMLSAACRRELIIILMLIASQLQLLDDKAGQDSTDDSYVANCFSFGQFDCRPTFFSDRKNGTASDIDLTCKAYDGIGFCEQRETYALVLHLDADPPLDAEDGDERDVTQDQTGYDDLQDQEEHVQLIEPVENVEVTYYGDAHVQDQEVEEATHGDTFDDFHETAEHLAEFGEEEEQHAADLGAQFDAHLDLTEENHDGEEETTQHEDGHDQDGEEEQVDHGGEEETAHGEEELAYDAEDPEHYGEEEPVHDHDGEEDPDTIHVDVGHDQHDEDVDHEDQETDQHEYVDEEEPALVHDDDQYIQDQVFQDDVAQTVEQHAEEPDHAADEDHHEDQHDDSSCEDTLDAQEGYVDHDGGDTGDDGECESESVGCADDDGQDYGYDACEHSDGQEYDDAGGDSDDGGYSDDGGWDYE